MRLICIPAVKGHVIYVDYSIKMLIDFVPDANFLIVTPDVESFKYLTSDKVSVKPDADYADVSPDGILKNLIGEKKLIYKWYYQQLLKYSIITKSNEYSDVLIIDADTIILSDCIKDFSSIYLNTIEYNRPYFDFILDLFSGNELLKKSAIVNYMWFNVSLTKNMLAEIENVNNRKWFEVLLDKINKFQELRVFSEYETYANYKFNHLQPKLKTLKVFRRADLFTDYYSLKKIINVASILKFDLISFEESHKKSYLKKIEVLIIVFAIEIILFFKGKRKIL